MGEMQAAQEHSTAATEPAPQTRKSRLASALAAALWLGLLTSLVLLAYAYVLPHRFRDTRSCWVAVYAVHLNSPQTLAKIAANRVHTADLCEEIAAGKRPVLCAGDFNFNETTPQYAAMTRVGLTSTHELASGGRGSTWSRLPRYRRYLPGIRIDHILLSRDCACSRSETSADYNSDHIAVIADVILRGG